MVVKNKKGELDYEKMGHSFVIFDWNFGIFGF